MTKEQQIENALKANYGVDKVHWLEDGIVGDDTDGHIDDTIRFVNNDTVIAAVEKDRTDANHTPLKENFDLLKKIRLNNGGALNIVELPMPAPVYSEGVRLPASYANFYISNDKVIVPIYEDVNDDVALKVIQSCFTSREIVGINSREIIWGLGSWVIITYIFKYPLEATIRDIGLVILVSWFLVRFIRLAEENLIRDNRDKDHSVEMK